MSTTIVPIETTEAINSRILAVSEDRIQGFHARPFAEVARLAGVEESTVIQRVRVLLESGTIRRVRQTLLATSLAQGALVAWQVPESKLQAAFEWMYHQDPFTGHVVIRSTDADIAGARYRLWTTLKVPQGFTLQRHCEFLCRQTGASAFRLLPAKKLFALGVGHVRRRGLEPGSKSDELAEVIDTKIVELSEFEWRVLVALKRDLAPEEIVSDPWTKRAEDAGIDFNEFCEAAMSLAQRGVIGRFSTFLEHVKTLQSGERVTRFNGLFHWAVPVGREIDAGREVGRFHVMTHAYWREAGPEFGNVNIMGVAHGTDKTLMLAHKQAIDDHLNSVGIPIGYTSVFWGGRSEIKPSEISPIAYREWVAAVGM